MESALKRAVTATLRPVGFRGSFPHLRRISIDRIDLISFQFHSAGGSFVVNVASCDPAGHTFSWGEHVPPAAVTAIDIYPPTRTRVGSDTFPRGDHWFAFGPRSYEGGTDRVRPEAHYDAIAAQAIGFVRTQAEPYWDSFTY